MLIGERLRAIREAKELSQGKIEKRSGLLRAYLSRVEHGHTVPSIETLEKLARALEVPLYQLLYEGEEPPKLRAGEITEASYRRAGKIIKATVKGAKTAKGARGSLIFTEGRKVLLGVVADIARNPAGPLVVQSKIAVKVKRIAYTIFMAVSDKTPSLAAVRVRLGKSKWAGTFDLDKWDYTKSVHAPGHEQILSQAVARTIDPLMPVLERNIKHYYEASKGAFSTTLQEPPEISDPRFTSSPGINWGKVWKFVKGPGCRIACWGAGGAIATACGGALCGLAAGAGAAACSEACPG